MHRFQPGGGSGHEGSGCHPGGGTQPGGAGGHPGGGLNRIGIVIFLSIWRTRGVLTGKRVYW